MTTELWIGPPSVFQADVARQRLYTHVGPKIVLANSAPEADAERSRHDQWCHIRGVKSDGFYAFSVFEALGIADQIVDIIKRLLGPGVDLPAAMVLRDLSAGAGLDPGSQRELVLSKAIAKATAANVLTVASWYGPINLADDALLAFTADRLLRVSNDGSLTIKVTPIRPSAPAVTYLGVQFGAGAPLVWNLQPEPTEAEPEPPIRTHDWMNLRN